MDVDKNQILNIGKLNMGLGDHNISINITDNYSDEGFSSNLCKDICLIDKKLIMFQKESIIKPINLTKDSNSKQTKKSIKSE